MRSRHAFSVTLYLWAFWFFLPSGQFDCPKYNYKSWGAWAHEDSIPRHLVESASFYVQRAELRSLYKAQLKKIFCLWLRLIVLECKRLGLLWRKLYKCTATLIIIISIISCTLHMPAGEWSHDPRRTCMGEDVAAGRHSPWLSKILEHEHVWHLSSLKTELLCLTTYVITRLLLEMQISKKENEIHS